MEACLHLLHRCALLALVFSFACAYPPGSMREGTVSLNSNRIICPVMAAMVNEGDLHPDVNGSVLFQDMFNGLYNGILAGEDLAGFQAIGISDYDLANKASQRHRDRCIPASPCWWKQQAAKSAGLPPPADTYRWINVYAMSGLMTVQHGFSTGVRGGASNGPEFDHTGGPCNGTYPCQDRYKNFYLSCADPATGRFYRKNIACIICKALTMGERGGEFSYAADQSAQQWQINNAMFGWLAAFGRLDEQKNKDPYGEHVYFESEDVHRMVIEGYYPKGWVPRRWGNMTIFQETSYMTLPCADAKGVYPPQWQNTSCPVDTGFPCYSGIGFCGTPGSICVNGRCICGRDENGIGMCASTSAENGATQCVRRQSTCTYFGEKCNIVWADNDAPKTVGPYF